MKKLTLAQREPYVVRLPKDATSPTGSIYKTFDIVKQDAVLSTFSEAGLTVRSRAAFTLAVKTGKKGAVKIIESKLPGKT